MTQWSSSEESEGRNTRASLLLAVPQMRDPNFMHTVVLMCEHSQKGAYGFVVNQPAGRVLSELVPDHELLRELDFPVHIGGPVGHEALQFVHRCPEAIPDGHLIAPGLYLGGELAALAEALRRLPDATERIRLFLGHSGWSAGQLDCELATDSWVVAPLALPLVFSEESPEVIWRKALRGLGLEGERLSQLPPDVSWN